MSATEAAVPPVPRTYISPYAKRIFWIRPPRVIRETLTGQVIDHDLGHKIEFDRGRYTTSDPVEIAFLDRMLGPEVTVVEGSADAPPIGGPEIVGAVTTASAVDERKQYRCPECGRGPFANAVALAGHRRSHEAAARRAEAAQAAGDSRGE